MICWNVPVITKHHYTHISEADGIDVESFFFIFFYFGVYCINPHRNLIVLDALASICQLCRLAVCSCLTFLELKEEVPVFKRGKKGRTKERKRIMALSNYPWLPSLNVITYGREKPHILQRSSNGAEGKH